MFSIKELEGLGTRWWLEFFDQIPNTAKLEARIRKEISKFEQNYSRFLSNSQLTLLNEKRFIEDPSPELVKLIRLGMDFSVQTRGYFNPVIGEVLENSGYDANYSFQSKDNLESAKIPAVVDFVKLEQDKISFVGSGNWDFGGYGKGFLIDKLAEIFKQEFGLSEFLINGGGDILVSGEFERELILENPFQPGFEFSRLRIGNGALAASSSEKRAWSDQHQNNFSHIIDPTKASSVVSVGSFVIGKTAMVSDVLATVVCILGDEEELLKTICEQFEVKYFYLKKE